jgi:hypothetical protein
VPSINPADSVQSFYRDHPSLSNLPDESESIQHAFPNAASVVQCAPQTRFSTFEGAESTSSVRQIQYQACYISGNSLNSGKAVYKIRESHISSGKVKNFSHCIENHTSS